MSTTETQTSLFEEKKLDTSALKKFAQAARTQLLDIVAAKLERVLAKDSLARRETKKGVEELEKQIQESSRDQVIERVAYVWFNRFCALRYMDISRFTKLGTVSPAEGFSQPEILADAKQGVIDNAWNVDKAEVLGLLDGSLPSDDPQQETYQLLLIGVCNHYHKMMPFMFERISDYTELLIPDDLLSENSVLSKAREALTSDACQSVEVIGWLYQFYISEKKDQVIGKVVKSEDIPAATQLFTPNWIVKYMVQNSLGAQWLATYPQSPLKGQMEYYIEPAEQTDEVNAQLAAITPSQLNPEELTLIDPASGSGHILVEAYELFKAIYLERGYRQRDVPQLILEKNLFGLDIDERAAQLTGFALMMKGRADDRRLFERGVKLNVMALQDSADFDAEGLTKGVKLGDYGLKPGDLVELKRLFEHATTFGSLIQVPDGLAEKLPALKQLSAATSQDLFVSEALKRLGPLVQQAELLAAQYDSVVANPPYMGGKHMNALVKKFAEDVFPAAKIDLFACFIVRGYSLARDVGYNAMVTMQSWMFLSSFQKMREQLLREKTICTMAHLGARAFGSIAGEVVQTTACVIRNHAPQGFKPSFFRLLDGGENEKRSALANGTYRFDTTAQDEFRNVPSSPVAYWLGTNSLQAFSKLESVGALAKPRQGMSTNDNARFVRRWCEVPLGSVGFGCRDLAEMSASERKWFPYNKGGLFRKWYGNSDLLVNWENDGREIKHWLLNNPKDPNTTHWSRRIINTEFYGQSGLTWTFVSSSALGVRYTEEGFLFDVGGSSIFPGANSMSCLGLLCSNVAWHFIKALNPTINIQAGNIGNIPWKELEAESEAQVVENVEGIVGSARNDWDAYERSWDFQSLPILTASTEPVPTLESSYTTWTRENKGTIAEMKRLEEENNRLFIDAYGLADELTPDVPPEQITLTVNPAYRYGGKLSEEEQWTRFRQDTMEELVSYAIGCMMGRYSLDAPGLIMANTGQSVEDYDRIVREKRVENGQMQSVDDPYECSFQPDDDNVIPIVDGEWFADDIVTRFKTFLKVTWGTENYEENLRWLEDGLHTKNATAKTRKTLRDYFLKDFYGKHISTYKKRPIYWLFASPKGTFGALIYMHRYRPDTVSIILNDYLRDFQTKLSSKADHLQTIADSGDSSKAEKAKAIKEINVLKKQLKELEEYERDVLYPLATKQIEIDLDDGVAKNYNKFGTALKKVTGLTGKA